MSSLSAVVAKNHGDVCLVDMSCWHQGVESAEDTILRRWYQSENDLMGGISSLVAVPSVTAIVAPRAGRQGDQQSNML